MVLVGTERRFTATPSGSVAVGDLASACTITIRVGLAEPDGC